MRRKVNRYPQDCHEHACGAWDDAQQKARRGQRVPFCEWCQARSITACVEDALDNWKCRKGDTDGMENAIAEAIST